MSGRPPFTVTVWTKNYVRRGVVGGLQALHATMRKNTPGDAEFTMAADHPRVDDLVADGARCTIDYRWDPTLAPLRVLSGRILQRSAKGRRDVATRTFEVADDWEVFNNVLGVPNPTGTMDQQGDDGAYWTMTGPAETVLLEALRLNAKRAGLALFVPASGGRGGPISVSLRMDPLSDKLFPAFDQAGLGVRVVQREALDGTARRVVEVYVPKVYGRVLTERSGVIVGDPEAQVTPPTLTHVIVGAGGEGEARKFRRYAAPADVLSRAGEVLEDFVDARDIDATDPDVDKLMADRAAAKLLEGAGSQGVKVQLAEGAGFRFPRTFGVGDLVPVQVGSGGGGVLTDYVREVALDWTDEDGPSVVPLVGDWSGTANDELYGAVANSQTRLRILERR